MSPTYADMNPVPPNAWTLDDGRVIYLLKPDELDRLADGTVVVCIDGTESVKGTDRIDRDTRFGYLAYGTLPD